MSGAGGEELLVASGEAETPTDWCPDARCLVYERLDPKTKYDLWRLSLTGGRVSAPVVRTDNNEIDGRVSPDGRWLAYSSDESGRWEVYTTPFPKAEHRWQVSTAGGTQPAWRRDGKELFFLGPDRRLMAVEVSGARGFEGGTPRALFPTRARYTGNVAYDVSADGQRFVVNNLVSGESTPPMTVVLDWTADLAKKGGPR